MDATSLIGVALGAVVGLILALTGAGGGILAVPLLVFGLHLSISRAAPVGLFAVGVASAVGAVLGLREGLVRYRAAAMIGVAGMVLVPFGVHLSRIIPNAPLTVGFAFVLAWVSWRMFRQTRDPANGVNAKRTTVPCVVDPARGRLIWTMPCARALASTGAVSGFLSGLLGVGGGFVIVPSLSKYTNLDARSIVATSLAVIALVSISGVASAAIQGSVEWVIAIPFACGAIPALIGGRQIAARIAGARLQQAFAVTGATVSLLLMARGLGLISG